MKVVMSGRTSHRSTGCSASGFASITPKIEQAQTRLAEVR